MKLLEFEPIEQSKPALEPGLAFHASPDDRHYYRLTHVFPKCVYYVVVTTAEAARYCGKPQRLPDGTLKLWTSGAEGRWGRIKLPGPFLLESEARGKLIEKRKEWLAPLLVDLEAEPFLRDQFIPRIKAHAATARISWLTLRRMLIRYYYFGRSDLCLCALPRGRKPDSVLASGLEPRLERRRARTTNGGEDGPEEPQRAPLRPGRRTRLTARIGEHKVIFDKTDEEDMAKTLRESLQTPGKKMTILAIMKRYRDGRFKDRHPERWAAFDAGEELDPITRRIFSYRTRNVQLTDNEKAHLLHKRKEANTGYLAAQAPGDICEMDGTGGRLWIVLRDADGHIVELGKANIYIFIDRWSRFINGVHITLSNNSYDSLRTALLYAFTAREERFARIGVDARESRWPRSRIPVELTTDRGPEFLGEQIITNVVAHLGIVHTPLKAYFPNGKGIVERFIRYLKLRMSQELKGAFTSAIKDRETKIESEKVRMAAVETLRDAYRILLEIVMRYNNKPHRTLQKLGILKQNGVLPTPQAAYVWGLKHIAGARMSRFTDEQFAILVQRTEKAYISGGVLKFDGNDYVPVDELAHQQSSLSPARRHHVQVKVDTDCVNLHVLVGAHGQLAHFTATERTLAALGEMTPDEAKARKPVNDLARELYEYNLSRAEARENAQALRAPKPKKGPAPSRVEPSAQRELRAQEDDALQRELQGKPARPAPQPSALPHAAETPKSDYVSPEEAALLHRLRKHQRH